MADDSKEPTPPSEKSAPTKTSGAPDANVPAMIGEVLRTAGLEPGDPRFTRALEISLKLVSGSLPLPMAEYIEPWERRVPGISQKIVDWTDKQGQHRRKLENLRTERAERRADRGQLIAGAVAIAGLALATVAAVYGATVAALGIALFAVGGPTACLAIATRWNAGKKQ